MTGSCHSWWYLARSLNNLSLRLAGLDRPEDALTAIREATGIYRELAVRWPDANQQELEQSLGVGAWLEALTALAAAHKVNHGCPLPPGRAITISRPDQLPELKAPTRLPMSGMTMIY